MALDHQDVSTGRFSEQGLAIVHHAAWRQNMRGELEVFRGFTGFPAVSTRQVTLVGINENDPARTGDLRSVFNLQLVAELNRAIEPCFVLNAVEKRPTEPVIAAAAVTDTEDEGIRPETGPDFILQYGAQVASFVYSAMTLSSASSTSRINGICPMECVAQLRQGS